jgi:chromosome segregation ATPase
MLELPGSAPRRRFTLSTLENLLLAIAVIAGAAIGIYALTSGSSPDAPGADAESPRLSTTRSGQADASAPVSESRASAGKQRDELRAQLAQATEQLKTSQGRISQLEAQLKQAPSAADLDKAGKQEEGLRAQLAQATEQLKTSQGRISQLEAQLKQAPSAADLDKAGKQEEGLRSGDSSVYRTVC